MHEGIPIYNNHVPKEFVVEEGQLKGMLFEKVEAEYDEDGRRSLVPTGEDLVFMEADDVLMAIGQENAFPWIERDLGIEFDKWDMPVVDEETFQSTNEKVFFGGDAAFGPENIITAVAHGHQAFHPYQALVDVTLVERAHAAGIAVNVWTVDDPDRMADLARMGVDGIFTNEVATGRRVVDEVLSG